MRTSQVLVAFLSWPQLAECKTCVLLLQALAEVINSLNFLVLLFCESVQTEKTPPPLNSCLYWRFFVTSCLFYKILKPFQKWGLLLKGRTFF